MASANASIESDFATNVLACNVQRLALRALAESTMCNEVVLHGSSALRYVYGFPRLSADLDIYALNLGRTATKAKIDEFISRMGKVFEARMPALCDQAMITIEQAKKLLKSDINTRVGTLKDARPVAFGNGTVLVRSFEFVIGEKCWRACAYGLSKRQARAADVFDLATFIKRLTPSGSQKSLVALAKVMTLAPNFQPNVKIVLQPEADMGENYERLRSRVAREFWMSFEEALERTNDLMSRLDELVNTPFSGEAIR
jgi:hypothetical protein